MIPHGQVSSRAFGAQGHLDVALPDDDIGHPRPGDLQQTVNAVLTRTRLPPVAVWWGTPKPRATPRARPSFHSRNADSPLPNKIRP